MVRIAVAGCIHGKFELLANELSKNKLKVNNPDPKRTKTDTDGHDLLLLCGDVQTPRENVREDISSMVMQPKHRQRTEQGAKEYAAVMKRGGLGSKPIVFVGGNHEAYNLLAKLPRGGYVAPNLFYTGRSSLLTFQGLTIAAVSGIFKVYDYKKPTPNYTTPLSENDRYSIYHIREQDVEMFWSLEEGDVDIIMSHDWPAGLLTQKNSDCSKLLKNADFINEYKAGKAGVPVFWQLMQHLKPRYWFAAHHHTNFASVLTWPCGKVTNFVATCKVDDGRDFLHYFDIEPHEQINVKIYDCLAFSNLWVNLHQKYFLAKDVKKNHEIAHDSLRIEYEKDLEKHAKQMEQLVFGNKIKDEKTIGTKNNAKLANDKEISLDL